MLLSVDGVAPADALPPASGCHSLHMVVHRDRLLCFCRAWTGWRTSSKPCRERGRQASPQWHAEAMPAWRDCMTAAQLRIPTVHSAFRLLSNAVLVSVSVVPLHAAVRYPCSLAYSFSRKQAASPNNFSTSPRTLHFSMGSGQHALLSKLRAFDLQCQSSHSRSICSARACSSTQQDRISMQLCGPNNKRTRRPLSADAVHGSGHAHDV
jgi:hypothetical protein